MTALQLESATRAEEAAGGFEVGLPVRRFASRKGQKHLSGLWWSATMSRHVGFESWLERDHLMLLDFDSTVVGIASQPFRLRWRDEADKQVTHVPDYLARCPVQVNLAESRLTFRVILRSPDLLCESLPDFGSMSSS